jgi:hypothetical protein
MREAELTTHGWAALASARTGFPALLQAVIEAETTAQIKRVRNMPISLA